MRFKNLSKHHDALQSNELQMFKLTDDTVLTIEGKCIEFPKYRFTVYSGAIVDPAADSGSICSASVVCKVYLFVNNEGETFTSTQTDLEEAITQYLEAIDVDDKVSMLHCRIKDTKQITDGF